MVFNTALNNISVISKFEDAKGVIRSRKSKDRQWSQEKTQRDKQWGTKHYKERATRASLKTGDEVRCSGRASYSCSTRGIRRVTLVTNPLINYENRRNKYWSHSCSTRGIRRVTLVTNSLINYENRRNKYWSHSCSTRGMRRVIWLQTVDKLWKPTQQILNPFLFYTWHPSCYSGYKPVDKLWKPTQPYFTTHVEIGRNKKFCFCSGYNVPTVYISLNDDISVQRTWHSSSLHTLYTLLSTDSLFVL